MEYFSSELSNGIRYIHVPSNRHVAHLAVVINAGTRDEKEDEHGIAHFIEHVIFKGTKKRKAYHILSRLEDVGGEIDAYTSKEDTVVYASFLKKYFNRAADLLSDILINSVFPEKEINKEKEVIYDEINSYFDSPSEQIYDDFENKIFSDHSLGFNILGDKESLKRFGKKEILDFIKRTYNTDKIVICSIGNLPFSKTEASIHKYFSVIKENKRTWERAQFDGYKPFELIKKENNHQAHCIVGNTAYASYDEKRKALLLLNNIIGGPGLNSRLNLVLREKHGLVYNIESNYNQYSDIGLWSTYFGTDKSNFNKVIKLLKSEMHKMSEIELGPKQLSKAKNQIIGQMAMASENNQDMLVGIAKSFLLHNKLDSFEDIKEIVNAITTAQIQDVAQDIFNPKQLSTLAFI